MNPEIVQEDEQHAQRQLEAGERVLTWVRREKNDLQDANTRLGVELDDVQAQLADSVKENKRLRHGIFSKCSNEPLYSSAKKRANRVMSVGMLTGRLEEEMPGSVGDLLQELSQLHANVRQVMQGIAQALWPPASLPGGMAELVEMLKGSMGHGEDAIHQGSPEPHGRGRARRVRWERDNC